MANSFPSEAQLRGLVNVVLTGCKNLKFIAQGVALFHLNRKTDTCSLHINLVSSCSGNCSDVFLLLDFRLYFFIR